MGKDGAHFGFDWRIVCFFGREEGYLSGVMSVE